MREYKIELGVATLGRGSSCRDGGVAVFFDVEGPVKIKVPAQIDGSELDNGLGHLLRLRLTVRNTEMLTLPWLSLFHPRCGADRGSALPVSCFGLRRTYLRFLLPAFLPGCRFPAPG